MLLNPGCESSSFQLLFLCQNFPFFSYFQPIFGILTQFHTVFPRFLSEASHTSVNLGPVDPGLNYVIVVW